MERLEREKVAIEIRLTEALKILQRMMVEPQPTSPRPMVVAPPPVQLPGKKQIDTQELQARLNALKDKNKMSGEELSLRLRLAVPRLGLSRQDGSEIIQAIFRTITEALETERRVVIFGFGTFYVKHRKARRVRNPRVASGPGMFKEVPASTRISWKPGTDLKPVWEEAPNKGRGRKM